MMSVSIVSIQNAKGGISYSAIAGENQTFGNTAGEALDAITSLLDTDESTLVILQRQRPDIFFGREDQHRLAYLMTQWREARDRGEPLLSPMQRELDALVAKELHAATERASSIATEAKQ